MTVTQPKIDLEAAAVVAAAFGGDLRPNLIDIVQRLLPVVVDGQQVPTEDDIVPLVGAVAEVCSAIAGGFLSRPGRLPSSAGELREMTGPTFAGDGTADPSPAHNRAVTYMLERIRSNGAATEQLRRRAIVDALGGDPEDRF